MRLPIISTLLDAASAQLPRVLGSPPVKESPEPPETLAVSAEEVALDGRTLVVTDMQDDYLRDLPRPEQEALLAEVALEIVFAIEQNRPIVLLEMRGFGSTHKSLTALVSGYKQCRTVKKPMPDGSEYVIMACEQSGFNSRDFRIIGIFTHDCVFGTTRGLLYSDAAVRVDVVVDACYPRKQSAFKAFSSILVRPGTLRLVGRTSN